MKTIMISLAALALISAPAFARSEQSVTRYVTSNDNSTQGLSKVSWADSGVEASDADANGSDCK